MIKPCCSFYINNLIFEIYLDFSLCKNIFFKASYYNLWDSLFIYI